MPTSPASLKLQDDIDDAWEDLSEPTPERRFMKHRTSPRKSKGATRAGSSISTSRKSHSRLDSPVPNGQKVAAEFPTEELWDIAKTFCAFAFHYITQILATALKIMRIPLSLLLFIYILSFITARVTQTMQLAFSPFCRLPGMSSLNLCASLYAPAGDGPQWANYPQLVDIQSKTFEELLENTVGGSALSLNVKKVEMATKDLVTLVRLSELSSKDTLAHSLSTFVDDARKTGRGLTRLSSKIGGTVDQIIAISDYAFHSIEAAQANQPSMIGSLLYSVIPFNRRTTTSETVLHTFTDAMNVLSGEIGRLILDAELQHANLDSLEVDLGVIHEIISREDHSISSAKSELLSALWTKLGGNRRTLRGYNEHLVLLGTLGEYRKKALSHVVLALQALRTLSDDMDDLRERVSTPELAGSRIPVEVHMKSLRAGMDRLKQSRIRAREQEEEMIGRALGPGL